MKIPTPNESSQRVALTAIVGILAMISVGCGSPPRSRQCLPCDAIGPSAGYCETSWSSLESCGPWNEVEILHQDFYQPTNHSQVSFEQNIDGQQLYHPADAPEQTTNHRATTIETAPERPKTAIYEELPVEELPYEELKVEYFP